MVLAQPAAWEDAVLVARAIDQLEGVVGERAPQILLARASYALTFESNDAARLAEATALVGQVLGRTPDSLPGLRLMSRLLLAGNAPEPDLAVRHLRRAVDLHPGEVNLYPRLIGLLQQQGDFDSAEDYLQRFRGRLDVPIELRGVEIGLLATQGDFATAVTRLGALVGESSPESEQLALASLYRRAGDNEEAERIYTRLLVAPDHSAAVTEAVAEFYADTGRSDEALALLDEKECRRWVEPKLASAYGRVKGNAVQALLRLEMRAAGDALLAMLDDPARGHRISGLWVVERLRLRTVVQRVERLSREDTDPPVRRRAGRVLRGLFGGDPPENWGEDSPDRQSSDSAGGIQS